MEDKKLTELLKGQAIKRVINKNSHSADQITIELESGMDIQLTFEPPIISYKVIKVTSNELIDEDIYRRNIENVKDLFHE